jgi:NADH-quinone oxidoreductase subunit D
VSTTALDIGDTLARTVGAGEVGEKLVLNIGPSHPSTHGVLRLILELDGEVVTRADTEIGYLHRGDEKIAENMTWNQFVPYTDRLDYLAPLANNVAYACAVEKLMGYELPPRAKVTRVICCELARISAHLLGLGAFAMDLGAMTMFLYTFTEREKIYNLIEFLTGARFTTSFTRVGGQTRDLPPGFLEGVREFVDQFDEKLVEFGKMLNRNRIFVDRTKDLGVIPADVALDFGLTGPNLRGSGNDYDVRKYFPYLGYETYEFDVPVGSAGDCYDRFAVRMEEMKQSVLIIRQAIDRMPSGAWQVDDPKNVLPAKNKVLTKMEELIHQFLVVTQGPDAPVGEVYFGAENPKGELGFYLNSKGGGVPHRLKIRAPSFCNLSILNQLLPGHTVSDVPAILGSFDFVMGECDR